MLYGSVTTNRALLATHRVQVCRKFESLGLFIMSGDLNIDGGLIDSLSTRCTSFVIHLFINNKSGADVMQVSDWNSLWNANEIKYLNHLIFIEKF